MITRRNFLDWTSTGLGTAAVSSLMLRDSFAAAPTPSHRAPKAKRVIHICLCGGLSQVDSFDYKPKLKELHGKSLTTDEKPDVFFGKVGLLRQSDWEFKQRGQSGLWISELFPHIASVADELAVINSMVAESSSHTPATFQESSGFRLNGFPVMGSWVSYGLGNMTDDLPTYVVLPDARGLPAGSTSNWTNGFLPAVHQGVPFRTSGEGDVISNLFPARKIDARIEKESRTLLEKINRLHIEENGSEDAFSARISSYELAARAACGSRGHRHKRGIRGDARALRTERQGDQRLRAQLLVSTTYARTRSAARATFLRWLVRLAAYQLGRPRGHEAQPRPRGRAYRPAGRRLA